MVEEYLSEMGIPRSVIDRMMTTSSTRVDFMSPAEIEEQIDKYDPAYQEWMIASCGELSDAEEVDLHSIISLDLYNKDAEALRHATTQLERERLREAMAREESGAKRARSMSIGYREYLVDEVGRISGCIWPKRTAQQVKVLYHLDLVNQ